jgi:hypothetical protein
MEIALETSSPPPAAMQWLAELPPRIKNWSDRLINEERLPNEGKVLFVARKALAVIAAFFLLVASLPLLPPLFLSYLAWQLMNPSEHCTIDPSLNGDGQLDQLRSLVRSGRHIESLHFSTPSESNASHLDDELLALVQQLQPATLRLSNCSLTDAQIATLSSPRSYYMENLAAPPKLGEIELLRHLKVHAVVLPNTSHELLKKLQELAESHIWVNILYYTAPIAADLQGAIEGYVQQIGPPLLQIQIDNNSNLSHPELCSLLLGNNLIE